MAGSAGILPAGFGILPNPVIQRAADCSRKVKSSVEPPPPTADFCTVIRHAVDSSGGRAHMDRNITRIFMKHFGHVHHLVKAVDYDPEILSCERKLLIGSYFTHEYCIESAAFFNPSMVEDPDQANLQEGQTRIIVSFRATGEGHISSLVFRGGIIDKMIAPD